MIYDESRRTILAAAPRTARSFYDRLRGMIGRDFRRTPFDAMIFERCNAIHSCGMSIPIDVIFLDRQNTICRLVHALPPWRFVMGGAAAVTVVEMPAGRLKESRCAVGDKVVFGPEGPAPAAEKSSFAGGGRD